MNLTKRMSILMPLVLVPLLGACGGGSSSTSAATGTSAPSSPSAAAPRASTPASTPASTLASSLAATSTAGTAPGGTYTDPSGFAITYPSSWQVRKDVAGLKVFGIVPGGQSADFADNLGVVTETTGKSDLTVKEYLDASVKSAPKLITGFKVVQRSTRTVSGEKQGLLEYTGTTSGRSLHFLGVVVVKKGVAYTATLTATPSTYATVLPASQPVLASFHTT